MSDVEGTVLAIGFCYGETVREGQLLVRLNVEKVRQGHRTLVAERIESSRAIAEREGWEEGSETNAAKRAFETAERALAIARARVEETRFLLDEGIISANEHEHRSLGARTRTRLSRRLAGRLKRRGRRAETKRFAPLGSSVATSRNGSPPSTMRSRARRRGRVEILRSVGGVGRWTRSVPRAALADCTSR